MAKLRPMKSGNGLMIFMVIFVISIIGIVFAQSIGDSTTLATTTLIVANQSVTITANTSVNLDGKLVSNLIVINSTGTLNTPSDGSFNSSVPLGSGNFTLTDNVLDSTGKQTAQYTPTESGFLGVANISYTSQPLGFVSNSAGRSMVNLVLLMFAVGLLLIVVAKLFGMDHMKQLLGVGR